MKYWNNIWLTSGRLDCPANEKTLFTSPPSVHLPGWASTTTLGPMLHFPCPSTGLVAVGSATAVPTPQISFPGLAGDRKNEGFRSPNPFPPWLIGRLTVG